MLSGFKSQCTILFISCIYYSFLFLLFLFVLLFSLFFRVFLSFKHTANKLRKKNTHKHKYKTKTKKKIFLFLFAYLTFNASQICCKTLDACCSENVPLSTIRANNSPLFLFLCLCFFLFSLFVVCGWF